MNVTIKPRTPEDMAANPGPRVGFIELSADSDIGLWVATFRVWRIIATVVGYRRATASVVRSVWSGKIAVSMEGRMRFWRWTCISFMVMTLLRDCQ